MQTQTNIVALTLLGLLASCSNSPTESAAESSSSQDGLSSAAHTSSASDSLPPISSSSTAAATYSWQDVPATHPEIRYTGRFDFAVPTAPEASWPGSTIEFAFDGTDASAVLKGAPNFLDIFVDNDTIPSRVLDLGATTDTLFPLAEGLAPGYHKIRIFKRTESQVGPLTLGGIRVNAAGSLATLPPRPERRIEFIGNSITCGYGNLDSIKENPWSDATEDHYYSYASMTARALGAEHHAICYSGRGVYRNNTGDTAGVLPELHPQTSPWNPAPWDMDSWVPQLVVVNLGTNDFYQGIPDSAGFVDATVDFVATLATQWPNAHILISDGPMLSDYFPNVAPEDYGNYPVTDGMGYPAMYFMRKVTGADTTYTYKSQTVCKRFLNAAHTQLQGMGHTRITRLSYPAQNATLGYGADWHPSKARHYAMAELLTATIGSLGL